MGGFQHTCSAAIPGSVAYQVGIRWGAVRVQNDRYTQTREGSLNRRGGRLVAAVREELSANVQAVRAELSSVKYDTLWLKRLFWVGVVAVLIPLFRDLLGFRFPP